MVIYHRYHPLFACMGRRWWWWIYQSVWFDWFGSSCILFAIYLFGWNCFQVDHCCAEWIEVKVYFAVMIQTFELSFDGLWQDKLRTTMTGWKSSQRSDSGRTTILASIQVFYFLIQEDGYLTLIIISGSFIQEHQSCSIRQILIMTRATWSSSSPRWTTVDIFISCFE